MISRKLKKISEKFSDFKDDDEVSNPFFERSGIFSYFLRLDSDSASQGLQIEPNSDLGGQYYEQNHESTTKNVFFFGNSRTLLFLVKPRNHAKKGL